jgi:hypothetical protein
MNDSRTPLRQSIPWAAVALSAVLGMALATGAASASGVSTAEGAHSGPTTAHASTAARTALHDQMRMLWEDHIAWTRLAIVTFADESPGFPATAERLLRNQSDIGDAIAPFYGEAAGHQLTALLHDHITIAVEVLGAAKAGDIAGLEAASTRWYANGNDIADFLAGANPRSWPVDVMRADMRTHLDQTLAEAAAELHGDYATSVAAYEGIHAHILMMADRLSAGIIAQFPSRIH